MEQRNRHDMLADQEEPRTPPTADKQPWHEPKLTFVEPTLTVHGDLTQVTGQGYFGGFTP